jgi:hypothetical protein
VGERIVGSLGAQQQKIDTLRIDIVLGKKLAGGGDPEVGRTFVLVGDMPLEDPRFLEDQIDIPGGELGL